jgi:hypothetical protein
MFRWEQSTVNEKQQFTGLCQKCEKDFTYSARRPRRPNRLVCIPCRRAYTDNYQKEQRKKWAATLGREKYLGETSKSRKQISEELGLTGRGRQWDKVERIERAALLKLRQNRALRELWDTIKDGAMEFEGGLFDKPKIYSLGLLDRALELTGWWNLYDEFAASKKTQGEAVEILAEIERARLSLDKAIADAVADVRTTMSKKLK